MKLKDFKNEIEARQHFGEKPFDKEPEEITKGKIQKEFYDLIETMWKDPKEDVFYIQSYAWDYVEMLLDKKALEVEEKISKIEQIRCDEMLKKQKEEIKRKVKRMKIEDAEKSDNFSFLHSKGYNKALEDILEELNK